MLFVRSFQKQFGQNMVGLTINDSRQVIEISDRETEVPTQSVLQIPPQS